MLNRARRAALLLCLTIAACHRPSRPNIEPAVASCIPEGTTVLAGIALDQLRASPLYQHVPPAFAESLRDTSSLVLAWTGTGVTAIARGTFREPPAGSQLIAQGLAVSGTAPPGCGTGAPIASPLLSHADKVAANPIWVAALGAATLPLPGNLANLNNILHATDHATATGRLGDPLSLEVTAVCRTPAEAQRLDRTVRAFVSLTGLRAELHTEDRTVRVNLSLDASTIGLFLR